METLWQDFRYGCRVLANSPGFTLVAVLSLALGIGANSAIFTVAKAVFLQPIPVVEPQRLMALFTTDDGRGTLPTAYPNFEDYQTRQSVFTGMSAIHMLTVSAGSGLNTPETMPSELVSENYFEVVQASPALGRTFTSADDKGPGRNAVAVLSHGAWEQRFGADPQIIGKNITVNRGSYTVIGVMRPGFKGTNLLTEPAMWLPLSNFQHLMARPQALRERRSRYFYICARLKPGVTKQQAQAALDPITEQLARDFRENEGKALKVFEVGDAGMDSGIRQLLENATAVLLIVVGLVLLIACANIAGLLLVRARARTKEFAVRLAMGAGAWRITRQLLTESVMLATLGGLLGLLLAGWFKDFLWAFRPPTLSTLSLDLTLDSRALLFTFGLSIVSGVLFGLAPALMAWRRELATELRERTNQVVKDRGVLSARNLLVMAQCGLSAVALIGAALFVESVRRAEQVDPGFDVNNIATIRLNLGAEGYSRERALQFFEQAQERVSSIPGVRAASVSNMVPLALGGYLRGVHREGPGAGRPVMLVTNMIGSRYFETLGTRILEGREFAAADREGSQRVVIVNEAAAKRLWPGESPVGKRFWFSGDTSPRLVVGLVRNTKIFSLSEQFYSCLYVPVAQEFFPSVALLARSSGDPAQTGKAIRSEILKLDTNLALGNVVPMPEQVTKSLWNQRLLAGLLAAFGLLGMGLAAIGVYGLTSYSISQRVQEIGIRMALGANRTSVMAMIIAQAMRMVIPGLLLGSIAAVFVARIAKSLLFGVETWHPPAYLGASLLLAAVALAAAWLPSYRATRIDPVAALRHQ